MGFLILVVLAGVAARQKNFNFLKAKCQTLISKANVVGQYILDNYIPESMKSKPTKGVKPTLENTNQKVFDNKSVEAKKITTANNKPVVNNKSTANNKLAPQKNVVKAEPIKTYTKTYTPAISQEFRDRIAEDIKKSQESSKKLEDTKKSQENFYDTGIDMSGH